MPKISEGADEQSQNLTETVSHAMPQIVAGNTPVVITAVNRKINIGNFENIDVYVGVSIPLLERTPDEMSELKAAIQELGDEGIALAAHMTFERYKAIKDKQKNKEEDE
jgi:hypothetical protein